MSKYVYTHIYIYWYTSSRFALGGGVVYQTVVEIIQEMFFPTVWRQNAKFENNQINTQPKYDHYQFKLALATKTVPIN